MEGKLVTLTKLEPPVPFLKWAGGKRRLVPELIQRLPSSWRRYYEPFVGGGALFFALHTAEAVLSDANEELINCYEVVRDSVEELIDSLGQHSNTKEYFLGIRSLPLQGIGPVERASRFIYLNRTCFNGLYRVNKAGLFNTPFAHYKNPQLCPEDSLRRASEVLAGVELLTADYQTALENCEKGDLVYLDPPYVPLGGYSDFRRYHSDVFDADDHQVLATRFHDLHLRGCYVMLSNSYCDAVMELYREWNIHVVEARRNINSDGTKRGPVREVVVTNFGRA